MRKITIFLASSEELIEERKSFEIEIYRKCKFWVDKEIFLHLDVWEDLSSKMSSLGRSQNDYNEVIKRCDILVLLVFRKFGVFSAEEFKTAFGQFEKTKKPFIFPYFKEVFTEEKADSSVSAFLEKLKELEHFPRFYQNFDNLWNEFNKELERLFKNDFSEMVSHESKIQKPVTIMQTNTYGDNVAGNKIVNN